MSNDSRVKSRVFITQESPNFNYSPAEDFGDIIFLTKDELSPIAGSLHNKSLLDRLQHSLRSFEPEFDFIACSGSPIVAAAVFMILASLGKVRSAQSIRLLRWSNRDRQYMPITITLPAAA